MDISEGGVVTFDVVQILLVFLEGLFKHQCLFSRATLEITSYHILHVAIASLQSDTTSLSLPLLTSVLHNLSNVLSMTDNNVMVRNTILKCVGLLSGVLQCVTCFSLSSFRSFSVALVTFQYHY